MKKIFFPLFVFPLLFIFFNINCKSSPGLAEQLGYPPDSILVIVHADDLGMHKDHTDGALTAMEAGMCKTGSIMVPAPDADRTLSIWKNNPHLDLGIHLTLTSEWGTKYGWSSLLDAGKVPSLNSPDGIMWQNEEKMINNIDINEALMEMEAQITKVLDAGLQPTHLDAHMGSYFTDPRLFAGVAELSKKYQIPMTTAGAYNSAFLKAEGYIFPDSFTGFYFIDGEENGPMERKKIYHDWLKSLTPGVHEIYTHIAHVSDELADIIEMPYIRSGDFEVWTGEDTKQLSEDLGIIFIGFKKLYNLHKKNMQENNF